MNRYHNKKIVINKNKFTFVLAANGLFNFFFRFTGPIGERIPYLKHIIIDNKFN